MPEWIRWCVSNSDRHQMTALAFLLCVGASTILGYAFLALTTWMWDPKNCLDDGYNAHWSIRYPVSAITACIVLVFFVSVLGILVFGGSCFVAFLAETISTWRKP